MDYVRTFKTLRADLEKAKKQQAKFQADATKAQEQLTLAAERVNGLARSLKALEDGVPEVRELLRSERLQNDEQAEHI